METFTTSSDSTKHNIAEKCPDVLIQKGAAFFLYNYACYSIKKNEFLIIY
jgi:hypothetical protein